jgi:uncharacterized protein (DUF1501 family)
MNTPHNPSRRAFLRTGLDLDTALKRQGLASAGAFATSLAAMGSAAAHNVNSGSAYKALVCLFMYGGNDSHNWVYPFDTTNYNAYALARGGVYDASTNPSGLALASGRSALVAPAVTDGRQFTMAPLLTPLRTLYDAGKLAVLGNVGPLVRPTTKVQYQSGAWDLPPKLFSHNDQQSIWQASAPEGARYGWAGRMGDLLMTTNDQPVFTSISATGNTVMLAGQSVVQYQVGTSGSLTFSGTSGNPMNSTTGAAQALAAMQDVGSTAMQAEYARIVRRSREADMLFKANVLVDSTSFDARVTLPTSAYTSPPQGHPVSIDQDSLAKQLRVVAQIISKNTAIGARRQVFMVSIGGFDTHDNHYRDQSILMQRVAGSIQYFTHAIAALGLADNVALFTASDFGRTLVSNGKGSDHGWGATHFIAGGAGLSGVSAVKGQNIYGSMAQTSLGHADDVGSGRLLPSTSVEQYAATLGKWFGLAPSDLDLVLPNLGNFATRDLGFMV